MTARRGGRRPGAAALQGLLLLIAGALPAAPARAAQTEAPAAAAQPAPAQQSAQQRAEALVEQAREAARKDQNAESADLFRRAIEIDPNIRPRILREYADQLTFSGRAAEAVPLFRGVLTGELSEDEQSRAERGLALALLWSGDAANAAVAWQKIVDAAPDDGDARLNLRRALLELARTAVKSNDNARAATLFGRAIGAVPAERRELLTDYAEQLSYSGKAAEAVPVFREALAGDIAQDQRARAERGLALALLWSGDSSDAAAAWQKIVDANPGDGDARQNLRRALLDEARAEARLNDNAKAADLYGRAIAADPAKRGDLLGDYAEQLTYSGKAADAVPLFREVLAGDLTPEERARAERGLALALLWSGKSDEAAAAWERILAAEPDDADARKNLSEAIIAQARMAAAHNKNARAAQLFERALATDPARRPEILREYADQLAYSGRAAEAIPLYRELLANPAVPARDKWQARRGLALAQLWSGNFAEAVSSWESIYRRNPSDADARKNYADALVGAARQAAKIDHNAESARLYARVLAIAPQRRLELAVDYAYQLTYSKQAAAAVPLFRYALASGTLRRDQRLYALLGLGLALRWTDQPEQALTVYNRAILAFPDAAKAYIGRAEALTQLDRNAEALASYRTGLKLAPEDPEAIRGAGQALSYLGRQRQALQQISSLIEGTPDAGTLFVAARASYWMGRPDKARRYAEQMLAKDPANPDALKMIHDLDQSQRPVTSLNGFVSTQNDGLVITGGTLRHAITAQDGLVTFGGQARTIELIPDKGDTIVTAGLGFFGRDRINDAFEVNASVFLNTVSSRDFVHVEPTGDAWLTYWPNDLLRLDLSATRSYFDDVKSVSNNVLIDTLGVSIDYTPADGTRLSGRTNYGWITDGNERFFGQVEGEQRVFRKPDIYVGARVTNFDFAKPYLDGGYFNPDWLWSAVGTLRLESRPAPDWWFTMYGSAGYEWQKDAEKPTWTAGAAATYTPNEDFNIRLELSHQDSADTGGSSAFRRTTLSGAMEYRW